MRHSKLQRRGIVLLVVLSLLTLFAILGVTFLLVAGQYKTAALSNSRLDRYTTSPKDQLHSVFLQLVRDTNTPSVLKTHGLLTDLYGNDGVRGIVVAAAQDSTVGNEFLTLRVVADAPANQPFGQTLSDQPDYYAGRVISFLTGPATNLSARVVDYTAFKGTDGVWGTDNGGSSSDGNDNDNTYTDAMGATFPDINERAERFWVDGAGNRSDDFAILRCELLSGRGTGSVVPANGDLFVINGHPFNGTGHGYSPGTANLDLSSYLPGRDSAWGAKGVDDDMNGVIDDISEAGTTATTNDDLKNGAFLTALLPNQRSQQRGWTGLTSNSIVGGADEDYDTFDYQNMFLAMVPPDVRDVPEIIPSFHRPALINYWYRWCVNNLSSFSSMTPAERWAAFSAPHGADRLLGTADDPGFDPTTDDQSTVISLLRSICMRPLPEDHPDFVVNNPDFHLLGNRSGAALGDGSSGRWDVDNDGDGIPDSIWLDVGLPVQTTADGRRVRPLVAILCQDLDGRLNLNAHDKRPRDGKVDPNAGVDETTTFSLRRYYLNNLKNEYAGTFNSNPMVLDNNRVLLPRGLGQGGAEVNIGPLFNNQPIPIPSASVPRPLTEYERILLGRYLANNNSWPGIGSPTLTSPQPTAADDPLSAVKFHHMPNDYFDYLNNPTSYLSPADLKGAMAIGLDHFGQPFPYAIPGEDARIDDPYEMFLGQHFGEVASSQDEPYTVSEFERLLRYNDKDASRLPDRLVRLANTTFGDPRVRQQATVLSSHIPTPASGMFAAGSPLLRNPLPQRHPLAALEFGGWTIADLYFHRLLQALGGTGPSQPREDVARSRLASLLPFELRHGQRFDLNREFGNGVDDNTNLVVDEPLETAAGQKAWHANAYVPATYQNANFSNGNDDPVSTDPRYNYARHLYCLAVMVMGPTYVMPIHPGETTEPASIATTRRRIAQWAVNVVDFRDSDGIMTGFEFDTNPFNGWNIDGDPRTDDATDGVDNDGDGAIDEADEQDRELVWGCEAPDLLITETFAVHDRGVKDTNWDDGRNNSTNDQATENAQRLRGTMPTDDGSLDQFRQPKGSLFFELLCPRGNHMQRQFELYDAAGNLDLGRMSPSRTIGMSTVRQPVWRVAIADMDTEEEKSGTSNAEQTGPTVASETYTPTPAEIDRIVWFANVDPTSVNSPDSNKVFYNRTTVTKMSPNGYLVVGPRAATPLGALKDQDGDPTTYEGESSHRLLIDTATGSFSATDRNGNSITPTTNIRTPAGLICAANAPTTWTNAGRQIGLNVSEPLPQSGVYYQEPNPTNDGRKPPDAYADISLPIVVDLLDPTMNNSLPDRPFDELGGAVRPLGGDARTGTHLNFTSCFLQRLADPTRAWNPVPGQAGHTSTLPVNPYITVDWASVDLTVFAGDENTNRRLPSADPDEREWIDPTDKNPYDNPGLPDNTTFEEHVQTRQRDGAGDQARATADKFYNIWSPSNLEPRATSPAFNATHYFPFVLTRYNSSNPTVAGMTFGYLNSAFGDPTTPQPGYQGAPAAPFPWMAWNNRPFTSPHELLLVPASSPSRLLFEFTAPRIATNYHMPPLALDPFTATGFAGLHAPSANALNFLNASAVGSNGGTDSPNFHRLLDFVEVPSPYIGAEKWYNPAAFTSGVGGESFRPPFNKLSRFRDPGRVNVNTILFEGGWSRGADLAWGTAGVDDDGNGAIDDIAEAGWPVTDDTREALVWEGIAKNFPELDPSRQVGPRVHPGANGVWGSATGGPMGDGDDNNNGSVDEIFESEWAGTDDTTRVLFERMLLSRQGYGTNANELLAFNSKFPSRFGNPFRSSATADMMPLPNLRKRGVSATLLRPDFAPHYDPGPDGVWGAPGDDNGNGVANDVLEAGYGITKVPPSSDDIARTEPLFVPDPSASPQVNAAYRNQDRNPYFRYQALQHLGNVLSTNSNTFAVWLTIGYFEVTDNSDNSNAASLGAGGAVDLTHPDGLLLGQEVGLDTGQVQRHRAFYIIDRSIPVAYEPGQNHNVEKAILLRRFIE